tara:strand:+ start:494 stop:1489 length:996 start_codon:yes stop_codon:yes gene_type:complete
MKKLGIFFTTRNNYDMLEDWLKTTDYEGFEVLNIDEDSTSEQKTLGKEICEKYNVKYMDREKRGFLNNVTTAYNYFKKLDIHWGFWLHHDCYPLTDKFFNKLNTLIVTNPLIEKFGLVGFNTYHTRPSIARYKSGLRSKEFLARAPLEPGDNWYRNPRDWFRTKADVNSSKFDKPFSVQTPAAFGLAFNLKLYEQVIEVTDDYHMMNTIDEIGFQFMYNNIYNLSIPYLHLAHEDEKKRDFNIPRVSSKHHEANNSGKYDSKEFNTDNKFFGKWGVSVLYDRWGIDYDNPRETFDLVKDNYKDTLLWDYYHHNPEQGPLKSFPEIVYEEDK